MLLLEFLPSRVTPGALAGELLSYSGVWFTSSRVTPGSPDQSCHFRSSCSVLPLLALFRSLVTPGASHFTAGALAQSCHSRISYRQVTEFLRRIAFAQSCHSRSFSPVKLLMELLPSHVTLGAHAQSWTSGAPSQSCHSRSSCPVMLLLELFPNRVTPGAAAGEFLIYGGVLLSSSRDTPGALAQSFHFWSSCRRISEFHRHIASAESCHSWSWCSV